ncbi:glycosyl hydrolase [Pseudofulvibacter geojedonensis]|uniref:Glycosyl hydrolase n=1 Tax=Pseudofulvibacter geojedonensis TaxID=1123758 RepID=A0ABW3I450_9FLAO
MRLFQLVFIIPFLTLAQQPSTPVESVNKNLKIKTQKQKESEVKNIPFKNIGPTIMSGRVVDVDVNPANPNEFYVGYASGGLWYTNSNGTKFEPILDTTQTQNIGDIAVDWKNGTIWVGTGENNSSRSSYAGIGILKSVDKGKSWTNVGLRDSHHIGRIVINPNNPDEATVGVLGHLYSSNSERGIYKTTDGGKTWKQTLFISDKVGIIDLVVSPTNFNIQYASSWERDRKAWNFVGSGKGSSIYKSLDGGNTWNKIEEVSGFPTGEGVGRIGLAVFNDDILYAIHDSQFRREKATDKKDTGLTKDSFKTMTVDEVLSLTDKKLNAFLKKNGFQEKYRAENVKQLLRSKTIEPKDIAHYLEDANSLLFDTPVIGAEVYKSIDGGKTWKKTHEGYLDDLFYSYGYYFGEIRVNPTNQDKIYVCGVPILRSDDGGKNFISINQENVHADHQALWVNPNLSGHLIDGNDGGLNISYDDGETWYKCNTPSVGQFYTVNVDNEEPYNVYGGLQDNGVWVGPNTHKEDKSWHQYGKYPYESLMGGDGMQIMIDNRNSNIVYTGYQFGNYYRINRESGKRKYIQPKHELGERPYRFNWQTPILLSEHNQDILYLGGNKLMRSMNQGNDWKAISNDLTNGGKKGNVAYGTITAVAESPFEFGLLYTGSDDGLIHVSKDGGASWTTISNTLPKDLWVSRVVASQHKKERVYVTLNGYRWDDFTSYIYVSDDYGITWKRINNGIPDSPVNVIREDQFDENILYVGTDNGLYMSFNKGANWEAFVNGIPAVAVHDLVIQKPTNDLVVGTHGRSIYKTNLNVFKDFKTVKNKDLHLYELNDISHSNSWGSSWSKWMPLNEPKEDIAFYSKQEGDVSLLVKSESGKVLKEVQLKADKGFNVIEYDLSITEKGKKTLEKELDIEIDKKKNEKFYLPKGEFEIEIKNKTNSSSVKLIVE